MVSRRLLVLAALALVSLLAIGWVSSHSIHVMGEAIASVDHTREVLVAIDQFRGEMAQVEVSARGYAITGGMSFRADFDRAAESLQDNTQRLKLLASDEPAERHSLALLEGLVATRLRLLRKLISLRESHAEQSEIDQNVMRGTFTGVHVTNTLDAIRAEELLRFRQRISHAAAMRRYAMYGPWLIAVIAVVIFGLMLRQVYTTLQRDREMRNFLHTLVVREQEARQHAEEADRMKDHFLATVSHELRTPLTSIIGWCDLLGRPDMRNNLMDEGLTSIAQAARVQSQLVEDLLDVSRIIAGRLQLRLQECDASEVVDKAINSVAPAARQKSVTIRKSAGRARIILGDPMRLEQIVWNLLSNAIKFTPANGSVHVSVQCTDSHLEIVVSDNGEGIAPDVLPLIFDRFQQGHPTGDRKGGLGLGLSIVQNLVELHGGTVSAESRGQGQGATFTVRLPVRVEMQAPAAERQAVVV